MITAEDRATYDRDGILVLPGVFGSQECASIRDAADEALKKPNPRYPHSSIEYAPNGKPALLFWPALVSPVLNTYRCARRLISVVEALLGPNVRQLNNQIYYRTPMDGDQFAWHQDIRFREPRSWYPGIAEGYLQTIIAVDDLTEDNGAVEFIPGSHLDGERPEMKSTPLRVFDRMGLRGQLYTAPAGSLLLWSCLTVHASRPNLSDRTRMTYMNGFCRTDCSPEHWPDYLRAGRVVQDIDSEWIP